MDSLDVFVWKRMLQKNANGNWACLSKIKGNYYQETNLYIIYLIDSFDTYTYLGDQQTLHVDNTQYMPFWNRDQCSVVRPFKSQDKFTCKTHTTATLQQQESKTYTQSLL